MRSVFALLRIALLLTLLAWLPGRAAAQVQEGSSSQEGLQQTIASLDAAVFDSFNRCDLETFSTFFVDDVEFYHDLDGESRGKKTLTDALQKNICGGDVRRELVAGTLQVYPMKGYGALEIGVHRFYHPKTKTPPGEAQFIHLWQHQDGAWKITRVISFDHHTAAE